VSPTLPRRGLSPPESPDPPSIGLRPFSPLLVMLIPGSQILIYPVLWILMPSEEMVSAQPPHTSPAPGT
jgi:hypothetical protein